MGFKNAILYSSFVYTFSKAPQSAQKGATRHIDWILLVCVLLISSAGLVTMYTTGDNPFFTRQIVWLAVGLTVCLSLSFVDFRFLRRSDVIVSLYVVLLCALLLLFVLGSVFLGAKSWFDLGIFSLQPSDPAKLILILVLAKYFSRRHVEIAHIKHILVSGLYALLVFILVFLQPDFGSAIIIFCIWLGMVLVSGISKKHLLSVGLLGLLAFGGLWTFVFEDYQKQRVMTFLDPLTDIQGAGYNAYQSTIAVGSGQLLGKGIGFGTQSKLEFLPEYETDFIFAAFAEEWGFVGVLLLLLLFGIALWRILQTAQRGETNFEVLFGLGLAILFISHIGIHIGMNIGLLPVTGVTIPFMSYGGSHLITEYMGLGILFGMRRYARLAHKEDMGREIIGIDAPLKINASEVVALR